MLVKAKFNGKSSIGFINGRVYTLDLDDSIFSIATTISTSNAPVYIKTTGYYPDYKTLRCEYQKLSTFLSLWEILFVWKETINIKFQSLPYYKNIIGMFYKHMRNSRINTLLNEDLL